MWMMTIADTFKAAGYATGAFGKWHNGMQYPSPKRSWIRRILQVRTGHWGDYFLLNGMADRPGKGFLVDDLTDKAMEFMEEKRDGPFFAYILTTPSLACTGSGRVLGAIQG